MGIVKFIEPMLLLRTEMLPEGANWSYELKLDGYRALAFKSDSKVQLRSRNDKSFNERYPAIVRALSKLPNDTIVDGEAVALDPDGRPSFNVLQNSGSSGAPLYYYIFDVLMLNGRDVMREKQAVRRELLSSKILPRLADPIRESPRLEASLKDLIRSVREQGLEGIVAKRIDSIYEPGQRSGAWQKMRINQGQEFVIGGYTRGGRFFDALVYGYYSGAKLLYAGRTRNGFTPSIRQQLCDRFQGLEIAECPFANLPEKLPGRWGQGLTAEKMKDCVWLKPVLVGQFEFVEWTPDGHLRHSRFVALREDKKARQVTREN